MDAGFGWMDCMGQASGKVTGACVAVIGWNAGVQYLTLVRYDVKHFSQ
jgi:hypothetical protein